MRLYLKHRVKGFTLSEMMVVMVLTVVVVGLAFAILTLVQRQMETARQNYQGSTDINLLRQGLWHDLRTYPNAQWRATEQRLELGFDALAVTYRFEEDRVIRNRDTLDVPVYEYQFFNKGIPVIGGAVDALKLKLDESGSGRPLFVFRPATAADDIP